MLYWQYNAIKIDSINGLGSGIPREKIHYEQCLPKSCKKNKNTQSQW